MECNKAKFAVISMHAFDHLCFRGQINILETWSTQNFHLEKVWYVNVFLCVFRSLFTKGIASGSGNVTLNL